MSQHLSNAIGSISQEIERLTDLRDQLSRMNDESGSSISSAPPTSSAKKGAGKKAAQVNRSGRPPVSDETRKKMGDARRAFFAIKAGGTKNAGPKVVTKKSAGKKSASKKSTAKKTVPAKQSQVAV
jgi:hypothetical protein